MFRQCRVVSLTSPEGGLQRSEGYSFVELLIALALMAVLLGGLYTALFQSQATFEAQMDAADLRQTARVAIEKLATELRMAGADIGNLPEALDTAREFDIAFVTDIDNDSPAPPCGAAIETAPDGGAERITYQIINGALNRRVECWDGVSWSNEFANQPLVPNLMNPAINQAIFRYFDEDGVELVPPTGGGLTAAERDAVRVVRVTLVLDDGRQHVLADSLVDFQITTQVRMRNAGL